MKWRTPSLGGGGGRLTRRGHEPREPEITELDDAELRDEDVLGLDVAVDDLKEFAC